MAENTQEVQSVIRYDDVSASGLMDVLNELAKSKGQGIYSSSVATRHYILFENLFRHWLGRRICETYPQEATRKWIEIKINKDPKHRQAKAFHEYMDRLLTKDRFAEADTLGNIYGGAAIIIVADDGREVDEPINRKNIKRIESLEVVDATNLRPYLADLSDPKDPELYELITDRRRKKVRQALGDKTSLKIHRSRVLRFDGVELPTNLMLRKSDGWGDSLLLSTYEAFCNYRDTFVKMADNVQNQVLTVVKRPKFNDLLKNKDKYSELQAAFATMKIMWELMGAVMIDSNTDISHVTRTFQGVPDMAEQFASQIVAATDIPYSFLFGRGPKGLNAEGTGTTEAKMMSGKVQKYQERKYARLLDRLLKLIWLAKDSPTKGKLPKEWGYEFISTYEETIEEKLAARVQQSQLDDIYMRTEVLTAEEVRNSRFNTAEEFDFDTQLDNQAWEENKRIEELQQLSAFGFGGGLGGFGGPPGVDAQAQPAEEEPTEEVRQESADDIMAIAQRKFVDVNSRFAQMWIRSQLS
jgi:phage-related protein (TIGR01555 family)